MTIMDLLRIRDRMIKTQILGKIPPDERQRFESDCNDAFQKASRRWAEQQLPNLVGTDQAKVIIERFERDPL